MPRMERLRRRPLVIALRVAVVLGFAGCSNQQMSASNPFMAPDRVPPPATRTLAPGTAAPYYPGDPVPAAQNAVPGQPTLAQAAASPPANVPTAQSPIFGSPAVAPATQAAALGAPQPLAFSNERTVAIPSDNADLRFAVPSPPTVQTPPATATTASQAAVPPQSAVIPAAYGQPIATQPAPAAAPVPAANEGLDGGPWRSPQIPATNSPVIQAQYVQPQAASALQMPVELRAVPSPETGPMMTSAQQTAQAQMAPLQTSSPPRMRFPSWTEPSTWFTPQPEPAVNQQLIGYMVPGPNGQQQMISVEQYQAMMASTAQPAASVATPDGFRARGTSTK